jgi:peptide/nickel transport system permease protein
MDEYAPIQVATQPTSAAARLLAPMQRAARRRAFWRRYPSLVIGAAILLAAIAAAVFGPLITPYDPTAVDIVNTLAGPFTPGHPLGTDAFGRDILSRILNGARIDLALGFGATAVTVTVGTLIGLVSGYFGGRVDTVIMRIVDVFFAFPFFVLVIALISVLGLGITSMFVAIWLTGWITYARIIRAEVLVAKNQEYAVAARAIGYGHVRIMLGHILPNVLAPALIFSMVDAVGNILLGSALGFLGLGAQTPSPEWGAMISDGQTYMLTAWWLPTMPGLAIVIVAAGFSLVGDGLADLLRPGR